VSRRKKEGLWKNLRMKSFGKTEGRKEGRKEGR
jgi:hypothetical protein